MESLLSETLAEHGLEENSGSYDDYRDAVKILGVEGYALEEDKKEIKTSIKEYFNIS